MADVGPGIPKDALTKIFDPDYSTKPPDEGTGLGLFLSYGIIRELAGRLWAANNTDAPGATFTIEFPTTDSGEPADESGRIIDGTHRGG